MTAVRGIRGATTADSDTREAILEATEELLREMCAVNDVDPEDFASVFFTTTRDITAEFPQVAARVGLGWENVALVGATEMNIANDAERCIRVLIHVNTDKRQDEMKFVYKRGAIQLRARGRTNTD